jgi:hypothetical protein
MAEIEITQYVRPRARGGEALPLGRLPALGNSKHAFGVAAVPFDPKCEAFSVIADSDARFQVTHGGAATADQNSFLLKAGVRVDFEVDPGCTFQAIAKI